MFVDHTNLGAVIGRSIIRTELMTFFSENQVSDGVFLDVGCGNKPYLDLYRHYFKQTVGFDIITSPHDLAEADFIASSTAIPMSDDSCECLLCTEVLEHIQDPHTALLEMFRVLRPNGWLILTVPLIQGLHEAPNDFYRFTIYGLRYLLNKCGFEIDKSQTKGDLLAVSLTWLLKPALKAWYFSAKWLRLPWLYSTRNPFVYLTIFLPQCFYLYYFFFATKHPGTLIGRVYRKLSYDTLGYLVIARKKSC